MSESDMRRKPAAPGPLIAELRTLLAAAGLPICQTDERERASGLLLFPAGTGVRIEWFVSLSLREAAALEQRQGTPAGHSTQLHAVARRYLHSAVTDLLQHMGYRVEADPGSRILLVQAARSREPTTLAADVRRVLAELAAHSPRPASADTEEARDREAGD